MESPESWFHRRATHYVEAQILFHLNQAGIFELLGDGGSFTSAQIADSLRLDEAATDALLDYVFEVDDLLDRGEGGEYSLSPFGRRVIDRFSDRKGSTGERTINLFDVRVGAYGPVWGNLGGMLSGESRYGVHFQRKGEFAENGVFKLAMNFWDSLVEHVEELGAGSLVEVGLTTGLLDKLAERFPDRALYGLDRSGAAIRRCAAAAAAKGLDGIRWLHGDFFQPRSWLADVESERSGLVYSLHFHELLAAGEERFVEALRVLKSALPGWSLLAFEQPRLAHEERQAVPETLWFYSQSNVLIHHLIGNGRIHSREAWVDFGHRAGCRQVTERSCNYLGYRAFLYEL